MRPCLHDKLPNGRGVPEIEQGERSITGTCGKDVWLGRIEFDGCHGVCSPLEGVDGLRSAVIPHINLIISRVLQNSVGFRLMRVRHVDSEQALLQRD